MNDQPLVDSVSESPMALLSISGMARRFCSEHPEQCQSSSEIQQLSTKLGKLLGSKCQNDELRVSFHSVRRFLGSGLRCVSALSRFCPP